MRFDRNRCSSSATAFVFAVSLALLSVPVNAQSSSSLTIAPRKDYVIEPGKSVKDTINIRNTDNNSALDLSMRDRLHLYRRYWYT